MCEGTLISGLADNMFCDIVICVFCVYNIIRYTILSMCMSCLKRVGMREPHLRYYKLW